MQRVSNIDFFNPSCIENHHHHEHEHDHFGSEQIINTGMFKVGKNRIGGKSLNVSSTNFNNLKKKHKKLSSMDVTAVTTDTLNAPSIGNISQSRASLSSFSPDIKERKAGMLSNQMPSPRVLQRNGVLPPLEPS